MRRLNHLVLYILLVMVSVQSQAQHSIAREWNEELLNAIRNDFARPTVHARNLWHSSVMMYDIWAIHDEVAEPFFLGKTVGNYTCPFDGIPVSATPQEDIETAISYAMYRLMIRRFSFSPGAGNIFTSISRKMIDMGYNLSFTSTDYSTGDPAALGNYIADQMIQFGLQDNAWEQLNFRNRFYEPLNDPLIMDMPGEAEVIDPNRWQPLLLEQNVDQAGNPIEGDVLEFLSPEWGQVVPFALSTDDLTIYERDDFEYYVYHDPGPPPYMTIDGTDSDSENYKLGFALVSVWSSHLDPSNSEMIDISPASIGNIESLPDNADEYFDFYNLIEGGDSSRGWDENPSTGQPYEPQIVPLGDYARILAEFWADGPDSETPPGHWFTILNYVNDHPQAVRKYRGMGEDIDELEWDVKSYFMLGGAMHDCAISAWGVKGWYDYLRPVSAIRTMAQRGQSTDPSLPSYNASGIPLIPDYIELVNADDELAGDNGENVGKIKVKAWRGPEFIDEPEFDVAGTGWILAEGWWPYQRPTFVTPPFAGYVSGHSTYSRAAAEVLTYFTGDEFFPGGMGVFECPRNEFLVFEDGPSIDIELQWATYRDASDQCSLSRIWGGIHPPADDIPGRRIGIAVAEDVVAKAETYFFVDADNDGYYNYLDCDDTDPEINPGLPEVCDGKDNDCSGVIDNDLPLNTYFLDLDGDGFGNLAMTYDTCITYAPFGYVTNNRDCNDDDPMINPSIAEICDAIDNNCDGNADEGLVKNRYYFDNDGDGYGDLMVTADTCIAFAPTGFVTNDLDCNDVDPMINPGVREVCDAIDNNCDGRADEGLDKNRYYLDFDGDGFGNAEIFADTCITVPPVGFVVDNTDCNDDDSDTYPGAEDIADNGIDEDCSGYDYYAASKVFPNPFSGEVEIRIDQNEECTIRIFDYVGQLVMIQSDNVQNNFLNMDLTDLPIGVYYMQVYDAQDEVYYTERIFKMN